jgi:hypothetical protein
VVYAKSPTLRGVVAYANVSTLDWDAIHFDGLTSSPGTLPCLLPGDRVVFGDDFIDPPGSTLSGFVALSGVFLEPSFPLPTGDLGQAVPHVVSASYSAPSAAEVGVRDYADYFTVPPANQEVVHFYVRRIRRFHEAQQKLVGHQHWGVHRRYGEPQPR